MMPQDNLQQLLRRADAAYPTPATQPLAAGAILARAGRHQRRRALGQSALSLAAAVAVAWAWAALLHPARPAGPMVADTQASRSDQLALMEREVTLRLAGVARMERMEQQSRRSRQLELDLAKCDADPVAAAAERSAEIIYTRLCGPKADDQLAASGCQSVIRLFPATLAADKARLRMKTLQQPHQE
jgi:hypothetical protein